MRFTDVDFLLATLRLFVFATGAGLSGKDQQTATDRAGKLIAYNDTHKGMAWCSLLRMHPYAAEHERAQH
jgi:hypothetical protein